MQTLLQRASDVIADHPAPALPLDELRRLVRGSGVVVGEETLLRALAGGSERFRVVDPWRGPWRALRPVPSMRARGRSRRRRRTVRSPRGAGRRAVERIPGRCEVPPSLEGRWVVARPGHRRRSAERGPARRLRETLAHLGWTIDAASTRDLARWCRLVHEAGRARERLRKLPAA